MDEEDSDLSTSCTQQVWLATHEVSTESLNPIYARKENSSLT